MAKFECFFCLYPDIKNLGPNDRTRAIALGIKEYSTLRIIEADCKKNALELFVSQHFEDGDSVYLRYPQCRLMK